MKTKLTSIVILGVFNLAHAQIVSRFDTGAEGWTIVGLSHQGPYQTPVATHPIVYSGVIGNPAGSVSFSDTFSTDVAFFNAPGSFVGNQSLMYGGTLSFDLLVGNSPVYADADVVLAGGSLVLVYDINRQSSTAWSSYSIGLQETAGWHVGNLAGPAPTTAQFLTVMGNLSALRIRADDNSFGGDRTDLDNVQLMAVPEPSTAAMLALGAMGVLYHLARRRNAA